MRKKKEREKKVRQQTRVAKRTKIAVSSHLFQGVPEYLNLALLQTQTRHYAGMFTNVEMVHSNEQNRKVTPEGLSYVCPRKLRLYTDPGEKDQAGNFATSYVHHTSFQVRDGRRPAKKILMKNGNHRKCQPIKPLFEKHQPTFFTNGNSL